MHSVVDSYILFLPLLLQVATNTETNRNAGNAILYECVKAIMTVESESGLKVLAVNILGRFLLNRDNNIRYVALNSLSNVVNEDVAAVQRHRATILDCLKDPDVSIRQRALELTYQLVNANNVVELVREMLNYLVVAPPEHRALLCSRVSSVVDKFTPSAKWQVETLITMLSIAGNHCDDGIACATVSHVTLSEVLHGFATHKLFRLLRDELPRVQVALMHVAVYCIGEFGDHLLLACDLADDSLANVYHAVPIAEVLGLLEAVLKSHLATVLTKSYVLNALIKLASRLKTGQTECLGLVKQFTTSLSLELQQRSCEYVSLLDDQWKDVRPNALVRMPAINAIVLRDSLSGAKQNNVASSLKEFSEPPLDISAPSVSTDLLDLDDLFGGAEKHTPSGAILAGAGDVDLLSDIFTGTAPPEHTDAFVSNPKFEARNASSTKNANAHLKVFEKDGLTITIDLVKDRIDPMAMDITCKFLNYTHNDFKQFVFQAAVPKYVSMEWRPASSNTIPSNKLGVVTQAIKVKKTNSSKPLMMRFKIQYTVGGRKIVEQAQISSFPTL